MTENHNSNANDEQPTPTPDDGQSHASDSATPSSPAQSMHGDVNDLDKAWAAFEEAHRDDLKDVASSKQARKFEKQAQRREKEALLHVEDLDLGTFTDDAVPLRERIRRRGKASSTSNSSNAGTSQASSASANQSGPRDFTGSSWLDADDVMDRYGDDFVPPNPQIGPVNTSKLVFWILLLVGVFGLIASVFVPPLAALLGTIFGLCTLLGAAGLIIRHKGHSQTRRDEFDDGARV
ncbi:hypothetical protein [Bifidobacterium oedipodis]|uniref:Membrane associated protein n=1 Tax=Bifidobacterium oedipodis TaxID=2675322 RepID=A0A7Y0EMP1_9BIFI|nr:hypothetical protein [Bifidobacterium sp. DSM 109957]NMM93087.1 hypothetical protein [Bifidobacterium sp. DSM 109957]